MKSLGVVLVLLVLVCVACTSATRVVAPPEYWPTHSWRRSTPEQQGIDSVKLADVFAYVRTHNIDIHSLQIVRNGYLVLDAYFYPYDGTTVHDVASVTKTVTATLIGTIGVPPSAPVLRYFPRVTPHDPRMRDVTIRHLLTMTSGIQCEPRENERSLREMMQSPDWMSFMLAQPITSTPGARYTYCSVGYHLLSGVISQAEQRPARDVAQATLFGPLGITDVIWPSDPQGVSHGWGDLHLHPTDMAKVGLLWLHGGIWDGKRLVPSDFVAAAIDPQVRTELEADYGYGWWVFRGSRRGQYEAVGRGGQRISILPNKSAVVVFTGGGFDPGPIGAIILAATRSDAALPANAAGRERLTAALRAALAPPPRTAPLPVPVSATTASGRRYRLDTNPFRLTAITFAFPSDAEARVTIEVGPDRQEHHPMGMDGVPRLSPGLYGLPVAARGRWDGDVLVVDYSEVANVNSYELRAVFRDDGLDLTIRDKTRGEPIAIHGTPEVQGSDPKLQTPTDDTVRHIMPTRR